MGDPSKPESVAAGIVAFVNAEIMAPDHPIGAADSLEAAGVDSMSLLQILLYIEREHGFWISDEDLTDEVIASVSTLAEHVCRSLDAA